MVFVIFLIHKLSVLASFYPAVIVRIINLISVPHRADTTRTLWRILRHTTHPLSQSFLRPFALLLLIIL